MSMVSFDVFQECIHTRFKVFSDETHPVELELTQLSENLSCADFEQFSLIFHGPLDHFLPQHTCQLEHGQLGKMHMFLVPIGKKEAGYLYQAVFNRSKTNAY